MLYDSTLEVYRVQVDLPRHDQGDVLGTTLRDWLSEDFRP